MPAMRLWRTSDRRGRSRRDRALSRISAGHRGDAGHFVRRGEHAADSVPAAERAGRPRLRGLREIRGAESDRLVQGSRDDGRRLEGGGAGDGRGRLRLDRKHLGVRRRLCRAGGDSLRRDSAGGQNRERQAGAGVRLRREGGGDRRQLRRRACAWCASWAAGRTSRS